MERLIGILALLVSLAACASGVTFPSATFGSGKGKGLQVSGLLFKPKGNGPFPAVVLLHTCGGIRSHVRDDWPRFLNGLGYVALTVDSYGPRGATRCTDLNYFERGFGQASDAYGALDYLAGLPFVDGKRVAVMGFSDGAGAINNFVLPLKMGAGRVRDFKAAIALYGHCRGMTGYTAKDLPLFEIAAEHDVNLAPSCIAIARGTPMELHVLKGAYHAFDQMEANGRSDPFGNVMLYSAKAVTESQALVKDFLARHLGT